MLRQSLWIITACERGLISFSRAREVLFDLTKQPQLHPLELLVQAGDLSRDQADQLLRESSKDGETLSYNGKPAEGEAATTDGEPGALDETVSWSRPGHSLETGSLDIAYDTNSRTSAGTAFPEGSRFRLIRPLAAGGLGVVSIAEDQQFQRQVALKQMQSRLANDQAMQRKFLFEAEVTGRLEHPSIVPIYALGVDAEGNPFYAMRLVQGRDLRAHIREFHKSVKAGTSQLNGPELRQLLRRFLDVCNAISYAHERGILHRDLKPGNVMLGEFGETFVVDWGLAKSLHQLARAETSRTKAAQEQSEFETVLGQFVGTPAYAPPEQLRGLIDQLDSRSDIYSLGAILFEILVGQPPVQAQANPYAIAAQLERTGAPSPRSVSSAIPKALSAIACKAMQASQSNRYQDARTLRQDVEAWLDDLPITSYRESSPEKLTRWFRRYRAASLIAGASLMVITLTALTGLLSYRQIANVARQNESAAVAADKTSREMLRTASRLEFETANNLIRTSYTTEDETLRASHPGYKSHWHLGAARLIQAIKLDNANEDAKVRLYSTLVHQGHARRDFPAAQQDCGSGPEPQVSDDGRTLVFIKHSQAIGVCELDQGIGMPRLIPVSSQVYGLCLNTDGSRLAVETAKGLQLFDTMTLRLVSETAAEGQMPVLFDEPSTFVGLVDRQSRRLSRWLLTDNHIEQLSQLEPVKSQIVLRCNRAGSILTHQFDNQFQWTNLATARQATTNQVRTVGSIGQPFAFQSQPQRLLFGTELGAVFAFEPADGGQLASRAIVRKEFACTALAMSPDGGRCAVGFNNGEAQIMDSDSYSTLQQLPRHQYTVSLLRFSPDGILLAVSAGNSVRVWNTLTGLPVTEPLQLEGTIRDLAITRDSTRLVTWTDQSKVFEYLIHDGGPTQLYLKQPGVSLQYEFTPDERFITSTAYERYQQYAYNRLNHVDWSLEDLQPTRLRPIKNCNSYPESLLSPSGRLALTYDMSGSVQIWEVATGKLLTQMAVANFYRDLEGHESRQVKRVFWSANEERIGCVVGRVWYKLANDPEACQVWNWKTSERVWDSNASLGGPGLITVQNDKLVCTRQVDRQFSVATYALDKGALIAPVITINDLDEVVEQELTNRQQQLVLLTRNKSTGPSPAAGYTLRRFNLLDGQPSREPLKFPALDQVRFLRDPRSRSDRLLAVAGLTLVDVEQWKTMELKDATPLKLENLTFNATGQLLVGTANAELRSRFWDAKNGSYVFDANYNGVAAASPVGAMVIISHPLNTMTSILDSAARYELEEPIQTGIPQTVKLASLAKFSATGRLLALQADQGLMVRELLAPAARSSIGLVQPSELAWIENWIGLQVDEQGVYRVLTPTQRLTSVHAAAPNGAEWSSLHQWLKDDVAVRTLTPQSQLMARDVTFAFGRPDAIRDQCEAYEHCPDDAFIRISLASLLLKSDSSIKWQQLLSTHLMKHASPNIDVSDPVAGCRLIRLLLPSLLSRSANDLASPTARQLCLDAFHSLDAALATPLDAWLFHDTAGEFYRTLQSVKLNVHDPDPLHQSLSKTTTLFWLQADQLPGEIPTRIHEVRELLRHNIAVAWLQPIAQSIESKDWTTATARVETLASNPSIAQLAKQARDLLDKCQQTEMPTLTPSQWSEEVTELQLSLAKPNEKALVSSAVDNDKVSVLRLSDLPIANGLVAPDPTTITYQLDRKWESFSGQAGLQTSARTGQLIFEIHGDGKLLWTSQTLFDGRSQAFQVNVAHVDELKLITRGVPNVNWHNAAVWAHPLLRRIEVR